METHTQEFKIRLGLFVLGGLTLFVLAIFIIGKQKNLFNPVFKLKATFHNVSGLQVGNRIRFSGINVGTVDNIIIVNDTTVRVDMLIKNDVWQFIKSDCKVTLGSEGIIGDKLLIISPGSSDAPLAKDGQRLISFEPIETDVIMARLDETTLNTAKISKQISEIAYNINNGNGTLGRLIQDPVLAENLNQTISNLNTFSKGLVGTDVMIRSLKGSAGNIENITQQLSITFNKINRGEGTLGRLIQDPTLADNLNQTLINLRKTTNSLSGSDTLMAKLNTTVGNAQLISQQVTEMMNKINTGNGTLGRLIRDTTLAENLNQTLINLKTSSKSLDQNMTAVKHNFFFKGYFDRKAREAADKKKKSHEAVEKINK
jgi:phospholipid/cholesterol/gamma-HCH transport system substrate-binding protein